MECFVSLAIFKRMLTSWPFLLYFLSLGPATWVYNDAPLPDLYAHWYAGLYVEFYAPLFWLADVSDVFRSILIVYLYRFWM